MLDNFIRDFLIFFTPQIKLDILSRVVDDQIIIATGLWHLNRPRCQIVHFLLNLVDPVLGRDWHGDVGTALKPLLTALVCHLSLIDEWKERIVAQPRDISHSRLVWLLLTHLIEAVK